MFHPCDLPTITTDLQQVIYLATNHCQHESFSILTHKNENMNDSLRFFTDSAILNRALEFPLNYFG